MKRYVNKMWARLWQERDFDVKTLKTWCVLYIYETVCLQNVRETVARARFRPQNIKKHSVCLTYMKRYVNKMWRRLWQERGFDVKMLKAWRISGSFARQNVPRSAYLQAVVPTKE